MACGRLCYDVLSYVSGYGRFGGNMLLPSSRWE
jgi:hypothetical protein